MTDTELLILYLSENFPSISEQRITDPEMRAIWMAKAKRWYNDRTANGFRKALVEFRKLKRHRIHSDETTLNHAIKALKHAGLMK